jgi:hypothetical protein
MRYYWLWNIIVIIFMATGCSNESRIGGPLFHTSRYVSATPISDPVNHESLTISAYVDVRGAKPKDERADWLTKVELYFGDDAGWIDVTQYYRDYLELAPQWGFDSGYKHNYAEAGDYLLAIRATYWDGELVYATGAYPVTVP